ncbi:MAG: hypothetical protein ISR58_11460 [Anaerolineales bacterium]|nr:hypothetical protein [Anaerolineales bacterium]
MTVTLPSSVTVTAYLNSSPVGQWVRFRFWGIHLKFVDYRPPAPNPFGKLRTSLGEQVPTNVGGLGGQTRVHPQTEIRPWAHGILKVKNSAVETAPTPAKSPFGD